MHKKPKIKRSFAPMSGKVKFRTVAVIIVAILLLAVGVLLLFTSPTLKYGVILIAGIVLGYLVWKAFIKNGR